MAETTSTAVAEPAGIPQLDFSTFPNQIFWLVILLGILFFIISRIALPRIEKILETRKVRIKEDLEEAERAANQAESIRSNTTHTLANAKNRAETIAAETRAKIRDLQDEEMNRVGQAIAALSEESEERIKATQAEAPDKIKEIMQSVVPEIIKFVLPSRDVTSISFKSNGGAK